MTILKALKNFIAKSGGSTKAGTIAEAINDMPVGGGGMLVVTVTTNDTGDFVADKTFDEIAKAFPCVTAFMPAPAGSVGATFHAGAYTADEFYAFDGIDVSAAEVSDLRLVINSDNTVDLQSHTYPSGK